MNNNLDELFKKALRDNSCEPPPYLWERIRQQLERRKQRLGGWWWQSIAAAALIAAVVGIWQLKQTGSVSEYTEMAEKVVPATSILPVVSGKQTVTIPANPIMYSLKPVASSKSSEPETAVFSRETPPVLLVARSQGIQHTTLLPELKISKSQRDIIPLTSKEALQNNLVYQALLQEEASPLPKEKKQVKVALSGHFVPAYSSGNYSSSVRDTRGRRYSDSQMEGIMNTGGGLRLAVVTGKHFSVQTGVFYSRMGQQTEQNRIEGRTAAFSLQATSENITTTPLGNIKTRTRTVAYSSQEAIVLNSITSKDQTLEQVFGTLEIPLQLRYCFNDNKLKFFLSGGFCGNFIVDNKVYLKTGDEKELLGSTEDIRNFNLSTDWGIGMEYPLGRMVKIMLEPGFRYYLQSLSRNSQIDYKPYMFTLSTGIGIEF